VRCGYGTVGYDSVWGPSNVAVVNQGTITADVSGRYIDVEGTACATEGPLRATNGATLYASGTWSSTGALAADGGGALIPRGTWRDRKRVVEGERATVYRRGAVGNDGGNLSLAGAGTWQVDGGTGTGGKLVVVHGGVT